MEDIQIPPTNPEIPQQIHPITPSSFRRNILLIIGGLLLLAFVGVVYVFTVKKSGTQNHPSLTTPIPSTFTNSTPASVVPPPALMGIPLSIDSNFVDTINFLKSTLQIWDPNFIITNFSLRFGTQLNDLDQMYKTGKTNPWVGVYVYSPTHKTSRLYQGGVNNLKQSGQDVDMSPYGPKYENLPTSSYYPSSPTTAVDTCISYAQTKGKYYLYDCGELVDDFKNERSGWMCKFVDVNQASTKQYLFETDFDKNNQNRICYFDTKTGSVTDWSKPPPITGE